MGKRNNLIFLVIWVLLLVIDILMIFIGTKISGIFNPVLILTILIFIFLFYLLYKSSIERYIKIIISIIFILLFMGLFIFFSEKYAHYVLFQGSGSFSLLLITTMGLLLFLYLVISLPIEIYRSLKLNKSPLLILLTEGILSFKIPKSIATGFIVIVWLLALIGLINFYLISLF